MSNDDRDDSAAKSSFDGERFGDIHHREFADARFGLGTNPVDGLPSPVFEAKDNSMVPPLQQETFVCMADEREFVWRDSWGEIVVSFGPEEVNVTPNGKFWVTLGQVVSKIGEEKVRELHVSFRLMREGEIPKEKRVEVEPVRSRCKHLIEYMTGFEGRYDTVMVQRMCGMCRGNEGEFMSLHNEMVVACMGREPKDFVSEDRLRKFNNRLIEKGAERVKRGDCFDLKTLEYEPDELDGILG